MLLVYACYIWWLTWWCNQPVLLFVGSFAGMSHMRLTAATGFLKLVRYAGLMEYISIEHFQLLNRLSYVSYC